MFTRLDANHDGVVTKDEIPAGAPEGFKAILAKVVADHNGKLTKPELLEAMKKHRPGPRPQAPPAWRSPAPARGPSAARTPTPARLSSTPAP